MAAVDPHPPQQPSYELLVYQLGELRGVTEAGFQKIDGRIEGLEGAVGEVKTRLTVVEVKQRAAESAFSLPGSDVAKVIGLVVAVVLAALGGDAAGVTGH